MKRSEIYLKAHERMKNGNVEFVCVAINCVINWGYKVDETSFPELFLFREYDNEAWLSYQWRNNVNQEYTNAVKEMKLTVLEFAYHIAKSNGN